LLDYSTRFIIYSNNILINTTILVINDVTNIVPIALNVHLIDLPNTPFKFFLDLSMVKYHLVIVELIKYSLNS